MNDKVVQIVAEALITATKIAGPVLVGTLVIGLLLSIVQSATQVQEQTLTFLPKLFVAALDIVVSRLSSTLAILGACGRRWHLELGPGQRVFVMLRSAATCRRCHWHALDPSPGR